MTNWRKIAVASYFYPQGEKVFRWDFNFELFNAFLREEFDKEIEHMAGTCENEG